MRHALERQHQHMKTVRVLYMYKQMYGKPQIKANPLFYTIHNMFVCRTYRSSNGTAYDHNQCGDTFFLVE